MGRVSAVQCVGGMTLGEEAAMVRECGFTLSQGEFGIF